VQIVDLAGSRVYDRARRLMGIDLPAPDTLRQTASV
jgi:hypothetical protein